jgi:hypothetical protein
VRDTRVKTVFGPIQASGEQAYVNARYSSEGDDIPLVNWKEMWLIRAELEGGQKAIDLVNELRAADGLPLVAYADPANAQQIKYMIFEERRRALFVEGRFFLTKLQNTDILWFPRAQGFSPKARWVLDGGVRYTMSDNEYILNPNLGLAKRGSGCAQHERPIIKN